MRLELRAQAGQQISGALVLSSDSSEKIRVRAAIMDFLIDQNQTPQFDNRLPSESPFSCRDWMSVNPMETEVAPGSQVNVRYTVRVPGTADSPRGYHCAVGFTTLPTESQVEQSGIRTAVQVVAAFYVTLGNPGIEGGVKALRLVREVSGGKTRWIGEVVLDNFSLTHFRPVGELSVLDSNGALLESAAFTPYPALPKREQRYIIPFQRDLAPGTYTLRARVDIGGNEIEEGTAVVVAAY
ncbi:MAG TPA: hypothetical protein VLY04_19530 [Bryobacteraceae bacterium]|nr:hypothetical protein [Bryobacteraceae bacterium]